MTTAGIVFDMPLGGKSLTEEAEELTDRNTLIKQAVEKAERLSDNRMISQEDLQVIEDELPVEDRYAFHMALVDADLRVRTGAVNVVDREEPLVGGVGDASVGEVSLWSGTPVLPRDELNTSPNATTELLHDKPRRTEGELHEAGGFGNNLTDLTVTSSVKQAQGYGEGAFAVSLERMIAMLNHAIGLEYSQALRYRTYADTLRVVYREALAGELETHADEETEHAQALSSKLVALGGTLAPKITEPVRIAPTDPKAVDRMLRELWVAEQDGVKFYRALKQALGQNIFTNYIDDVLVQESEHIDDLLRFGAVVKSAAVVPLPSSPDRSFAPMWHDSYHDENAFEGLDKMGEQAELGQCPHCKGEEVEGQVCTECTGKTACTVRALCEACAGFGFLKTCASCGKSWPTPEFFSLGRVASWQRRAEQVRRKTVYGEIPIWLEYEAGDVKRGKNRFGESWERKMRCPYGFIPGTRGADGEPVDVYLGGHPTRNVFVVSQMVPGSGFDEEKVMLGFPNAQQAEAMYRSHMPNNGDEHFGGIREMSLGTFEDEYMRADRSNPYKPTLHLRQFSVTGKMVPNPNPKGKEKMVTEEYAARWNSEHGGLSDVFQKAKQDKAKAKGKPSGEPAEKKPKELFPAVPEKSREDKPLAGFPEEVKEPEKPSKEPPASAEPAQETPKEAPVEESAQPKQEPAQEPVAPKPEPVTEKPKTAPEIPHVDTSRAVSPVELQERKEHGKAKELEQQFWRLLGGPGFNPYKTSVRQLHRLAERVIAESYESPDHGPLGTDGEPDHPVEDNVVKFADLSVAGSVLSPRDA